MINLVEILRLLHNLIRFGTVAEVNLARARVRIQSGDLLTTWLPWITTRAGMTRDWDPPTVGEQVVLFSPGGDLSAGVALTGIFSQSHAAPTNNADLWQRLFPDDGLFEYDHKQSKLRIHLPGSIEIVAPDGTTWTGDITHQGNVSQTGDYTHQGNMARTGNYQQTGGVLTHNGVDIGSEHAHDEVQPGVGISGGPVS